MGEIPIGYRDPEHEALYRQFVRDPRIQLDTVSPTIEGYFRIPAIWVDAMPEPASVLLLNPGVHHEVVLSKTLSCGIEVRAHRDGLFLFDFTRWTVAPQIEIPGYTKQDANGPCIVPAFHSAACEKAEDYAVLRAQAMNVHQACLTAAEATVKRRGAAMGFPVTAWNTEKAITFDRPLSYYDDVEDMHALTRNVLNNSYRIRRNAPLSRRVMEREVVDYSLVLLDRVLSDPEGQLLNLVESYYIAACRAREKRFGEAMTPGWSVCEQILAILWRGILGERASADGSPLSKERRKKLTGRDFTASIIIETLELMGRLDGELFRRLNIARQARNNWAHSLHAPKASQVNICMMAVEQLLSDVKGVQLRLQFSGRGGVPQWPVYMMEEVRRAKIDRD